MSALQQSISQTSRWIALSLGLIPVALCADKTLQSDSPFLPPGYSESEKTPPPPPPNNVRNGEIARSLELRGIMCMNATYTLSFFDKRTKKSFWIKENAANAEGYRIGSYDANSLSVMVTKGSSTEQVTLISSSHAAMPVNSSVSLGTTPKPPAGFPQATPNKPNGTQKNVRTVPRRRVVLPKKQS